MNTAHLHWKSIWQEKTVVVVSQTLFDIVKKEQGYVELSKDRIETSKYIYEVKK